MKKVIKILGIAIISLLGIAMVMAIVSPRKKKSETEKSVKNEVTNDFVKIGDVLHTDYFDVTVSKTSLTETLDTGNKYTDLPKEEGNKYFLLKVTFKNTSDESRLITDGTVWIDYNGKRYEFDKSELVVAEGWGLLLEQINPLISKTTNLAYKLPMEIKGDAYYQPGRSDSDDLIYLGTIK
ncbi:MAG: DUF4352 domain-containing protein [Bacteroidota bacterium]